MVKIIFNLKLFFLILLFSINIFSQDIRIFNIDKSNYPIMKSNIILLSQNGNIVYSEDINSIKLYENGSRVSVLDFECELDNPLEPVSTILSLDLSLSMTGNAFELAKTGARTIVDIFRDSTDEVAINGFSDFATLISAFTNKRAILHKKINNTKLIGGTNFNEAFLNKYYGTLNLAQKAKNKPVIIILTDGFATGNTQEVIEKAKEIGATVYSVILYGEAPQFLVEVSEATGGLVFENIETEAEIVKAYKVIYRLSQTAKACTLTWKSEDCEIEKKLKYEYIGVSKNTVYYIDENQLSKFDYPEGKFISFKGLKKGDTGRKLISIVSRKENINITGISNSNNKFSIVLPTGVSYPISIPRDSVFQFFIDFNYDSDGFQTAKFEISSNICINNEFFATGGIPNSNGDKYVEIIEPNGGEVYFKGADSLIKWQLNEANDKLIIEFSSNNGTNWTELARNYQGYNLKYKYPNIISDKCLVRITKLSDSSGYEYMITNTDSINNNCVSWQPSGNKIILGGVDGYIRIVDGYYHYNLSKYYGHSIVSDIEWAPDAIRFASSGTDGKIKIWIDGDSVASDSVQASSVDVTSLEWSPDGSRLLSGDKNGMLTLWNPADLSIITQLKLSNKQINDIAFSPDGKKIAIAMSDSTIAIIQVNILQQKQRYSVHSGAVSSLDWIDNDWLVSVSTQAFSNQVVISSSELGQRIAEYPINETLNKIRISRKNNLVAFVGSSGKIHLWGLNDFKEKYNIISASSWASQDLAISPDESRIVVASNGKNSGQTLKFYSIEQFPQYSTTSKSNFSLIDFKLFTKDIDFGNVLIDRSKDSLISDFIKVESKLAMNIDSVKIINDNDSVFNLFSKYPVSIAEDNTYDINVIFQPKEAKTYNANIEVYVDNLKYRAKLSGIGYENGIKDYFLDFGEVEVNQSSRKQIDISNSSIDDILIDSIVVIGPDYENFTILQGSGASVLEGQNLNKKSIIFEFTPNEDFEFACFANIYFQDKDAPARIFLKGEGIKPELNFTQIDTLYSNCDSSSIQKIIFKNTGKYELEIDSLKSKDIDFNFSKFSIDRESSKEIIGEMHSFPSGTYNIEYSFITNDYEFSNVSKTFVYIVNNSKLTTSKNIIEFVDVPIGNNQKQRFEVKNTGDLIIDWDFNLPYQINGSSFYIDDIVPQSISKGESSTFTISFQSTKKVNETSTLILSDKCDNLYNISVNSLYNIGLDGLKYPEMLMLEAVCDDGIDTNIVIQNISEKSYQINSISSKLMAISGISLPFNLISNENVKIDYKINNIKQSITDTLVVDIEGNLIRIPVIVNYKSSLLNLSEASKTITIDKSEVTKSYFTIENKGLLTETWQNVNVANPNLKIEDISPSPTLANETATFTFEYAGSDESEVDIEILDSCDNVYIQKLFFKLGDIPSLKLVVKDINANIGEYKDIEIELSSFKNFEFNEKTGISFDLVYNSSLLENDNQNITTLNSFSYEKIELNFSNMINNSWKLSNYRVLWGNDSVSDISVQNLKFITNDEDKFASVDNGLLRILDLCYAGGTRLFFDGNQPYLKGVFPNPVISSSNIEFEIKNESNIDIRIFNYFGEEIYKNTYLLSPFDNIIKVPENLNNGIYLLNTHIFDKSTNTSYYYFNKFNVVK